MLPHPNHPPERSIIDIVLCYILNDPRFWGLPQMGLPHLGLPLLVPSHSGTRLPGLGDSRFRFILYPQIPQSRRIWRNLVRSLNSNHPLFYDRFSINGGP